MRFARLARISFIFLLLTPFVQARRTGPAPAVGVPAIRAAQGLQIHDPLKPAPAIRPAAPAPAPKETKPVPAPAAQPAPKPEKPAAPPAPGEQPAVEISEDREELLESFEVEAEDDPDEFAGLLERRAKEDRPQPLKLTQFPLISKLPQGGLRKALDQVIIHAPEFKVTRRGVSVSGEIKIFGLSVWARIMVARGQAGGDDEEPDGEPAEAQPAGGKKSRVMYSLVLSFPKGVKFSDVFPKTGKFDPTKFDLLKYEELWLALSSDDYHDPVLDRQVYKGLTILGSVQATGPLF